MVTAGDLESATAEMLRSRKMSSVVAGLHLMDAKRSLAAAGQTVKNFLPTLMSVDEPLFTDLNFRPQWLTHMFKWAAGKEELPPGYAKAHLKNLRQVFLNEKAMAEAYFQAAGLPLPMLDAVKDSATIVQELKGRNNEDSRKRVNMTMLYLSATMSLMYLKAREDVHKLHGEHGGVVDQTSDGYKNFLHSMGVHIVSQATGAHPEAVQQHVEGAFAAHSGEQSYTAQEAVHASYAAAMPSDQYDKY